MMSKLIEFVTAAAADVVSFYGIPGGSAFQVIVNAHLEKRTNDAREVLISELSRSLDDVEQNLTEIDADELVGMLLRFNKAFRDGAAMDNLRLIAKVIAGQKRQRSLDGDKFRRWANILETLTRDEIIFLGHAFVVLERSNGDSYWKALSASLADAGYSEAEQFALAAALTRTGLITPIGAFGNTVYGAGQWLKDLGELAELDEKATNKDRDQPL